MLTQKDLSQIKTIVKNEVKFQLKSEIKHLPTKTEFYEKMDELMVEIKAVREEQEILRFYCLTARS